MLYTYYEDDRITFIHRIDRRSFNNERVLHTHGWTEIIYFISGNVTYYAEGNIFNPNPGDIMIFDKSETHCSVFDFEKEPYERVVISVKKDIFKDLGTQNQIYTSFFGDKKIKVNHLTPADFKDNHWENCLKKIISVRDDSGLHIYSNLIPFLNELRFAVENASLTAQKKNEPLTSIITYINDNLSSELVPDKIAEKFYISRSKLDKLFRSKMASSVWKYITAKRMLLAKNLLDEGKKPTDIYEQCGFNDYVTFYRAYKNHFGVSPRKNSK